MTIKDRGYFREKKESRMFHMRHKGTLIVEQDEIVFLGEGDNIVIKYDDLKYIDLLKARVSIEFETNDGIIYLYASFGDSGTTASAMTVGNSLFGAQGGSLFGQIAKDRTIKRVNEEIYKTIVYYKSKQEGDINDN